MLAKSHGKVVIEDLKVRNMTAGGGSRKRGLNRVVLDAAFGEFRRLLEYKGKLYGCEVVAVPTRTTPASGVQRVGTSRRTIGLRRASSAACLAGTRPMLTSMLRSTS